jgi:hypothetical protein
MSLLSLLESFALLALALIVGFVYACIRIKRRDRRTAAEIKAGHGIIPPEILADAHREIRREESWQRDLRSDRLARISRSAVAASSRDNESSEPEDTQPIPAHDEIEAHGEARKIEATAGLSEE